MATRLDGSDSSWGSEPSRESEKLMARPGKLPTFSTAGDDGDGGGAESGGAG